MEILIENIKSLRDSADTEGMEDYAAMAHALLNVVTVLDEVASEYDSNPRVPEFVVDFMDDLVDSVEEALT